MLLKKLLDYENKPLELPLNLLVCLLEWTFYEQSDRLIHQITDEKLED